MNWTWLREDDFQRKTSTIPFLLDLAFYVPFQARRFFGAIEFFSSCWLVAISCARQLRKFACQAIADQPLIPSKKHYFRTPDDGQHNVYISHVVHSGGVHIRVSTPQVELKYELPEQVIFERCWVLSVSVTTPEEYILLLPYSRITLTKWHDLLRQQHPVARLDLTRRERKSADGWSINMEARFLSVSNGHNLCTPTRRTVRFIPPPYSLICLLISCFPDIVAMVGEFIGTFLFLYVPLPPDPWGNQIHDSFTDFKSRFFAFAGVGVANLGTPTDGTVSITMLMYISVAFGFSLMVNAWAFYRISGGLFNPAVCSSS